MLLPHSIKDADTAHSTVVTHTVGVSSDESCVKIGDGDSISISISISIIRVGLLALGQKLVRILISH